jgi:hypothetical protein
MTGAVLVDVLVDGEAEVLGAVLVESETGVVEAEAGSGGGIRRLGMGAAS